MDLLVVTNADLFERFWLAGMRKINKKKAKSLFNRLLKSSTDPEVFTTKLIEDIQRRKQVNQFGFDAMHPTTYLNGERWNDEIVESQEQGFVAKHTDRKWREGLTEDKSFIEKHSDMTWTEGL